MSAGVVFAVRSHAAIVSRIVAVPLGEWHQESGRESGSGREESGAHRRHRSLSPMEGMLARRAKCQRSLSHFQPVGGMCLCGILIWPSTMGFGHFF